ncbi:Oxidoreductase molybdopterin binding domain-containing protein [Frankineae bacterium MT45]|nr:Oxidoreductase molybdopterin binding domain-containing protein [Frankineae bacterium MT45]
MSGSQQLRAKFADLLRQPPRIWPRFSSPLHHEAVTARVGRVLGIAFAVCFATGLLSHYQYGPWNWLPIPAAPAWGYRLTQGLHVTTGIACIPLLLVKLWTVYPRLFVWPPARNPLEGVERLSVGLLVGSAILELFTGFINILGWYPWPWHFVIVHFLLAFVVAGSIMLHIAVKLETIKRGLATPLTDIRTPSTPAAPTGTDNPPNGGISRRGLLITTGVSAAAVTLVTVGRTVSPLEPLGLLADRQPSKGPQQVPINTTAADAKVTQLLTDPNYRLHILGPKPFDLTLAELEALERTGKHFPLACVEGWSVAAHWSGPTLLSLVERAGGDAGSHVRVESLQKGGSYRTSMVYGPQLRQALLATHLNGQRIVHDHGYPVRLIAPDRAGVLNTKWLTNVVVL